jgi:hypothetical protein
VNPQLKKPRLTLLATASLILGCVACCALPIVATLSVGGMGAGLAAWLAGHALWVSVGVALLVFASGLGWIAARRRARS